MWPCFHCYTFEPDLATWDAAEQQHVAPLACRSCGAAEAELHARAFYTAEVSASSTRCMRPSTTRFTREGIGWRRSQPLAEVLPTLRRRMPPRSTRRSQLARGRRAACSAHSTGPRVRHSCDAVARRRPAVTRRIRVGRDARAGRCGLSRRRSGRSGCAGAGGPGGCAGLLRSRGRSAEPLLRWRNSR